jgi:hypothetical protein
MKHSQAAFLVSLAALTALPGPAFARPVYLSCVIPDHGVPEYFNMTVDEDAGRVSLFYPRTGTSWTSSAIFSPDRVVFSDRVLMIDSTLNRISLAYTETRHVGGTLSTIGRCKLQAPPKRAF